MCNEKEKETFFKDEVEREKKSDGEEEKEEEEKKAPLQLPLQHFFSPLFLSLPLFQRSKEEKSALLSPLSAHSLSTMAAATPAVAKPSAAATPVSTSSPHLLLHGHDEALPAPKSHLLLLFLSLAPAFLPIPANPNIVATASLAVFVGCWRSVKQEAPTESMTRKVR